MTLRAVRGCANLRWLPFPPPVSNQPAFSKSKISSRILRGIRFSVPAWVVRCVDDAWTKHGAEVERREERAKEWARLRGCILRFHIGFPNVAGQFQGIDRRTTRLRAHRLPALPLPAGARQVGECEAGEEMESALERVTPGDGSWLLLPQRGRLLSAQRPFQGELACLALRGRFTLEQREPRQNEKRDAPRRVARKLLLPRWGKSVGGWGFRWLRSFLAPPPANFSHPSGMGLAPRLPRTKNYAFVFTGLRMTGF